MNEKLFRKKSIEKVTSPEQLDDFVKVANPGIWVMLFSVILILVGAIVWGMFGTLDTKLDLVAVSDENGIVCYVPIESAGRISEDAFVMINDNKYSISSVSSDPIKVNEQNMSEYVISLGGLSEGQWVHAIYLDGTLDEGTYEAVIVIESVSPVSFLLNRCNGF